MAHRVKGRVIITMEKSVSAATVEELTAMKEASRIAFERMGFQQVRTVLMVHKEAEEVQEEVRA